jgi:hypothetical protein
MEKKFTKKEYNEILTKRGIGKTNKSREKDFKNKLINHTPNEKGEKNEDTQMKHKNNYSSKMKRKASLIFLSLYFFNFCLLLKK